MKTAYTTIVLLCAALLGGCSIPSLHGLYSADKAADDPALAGRWVRDDGEAVADAARTEAGRYAVTLTMTNKGKKDDPVVMKLDVRLVQLGTARFVDLVLAEPERKDLMERRGSLAVPTHLFMKAARDGDTLTLMMPDYERFKRLLGGGESGLAVARLEDSGGGPEMVITSPTPDLQKFVAAHAEDTELFSDALVLRRKP